MLSDTRYCIFIVGGFYNVSSLSINQSEACMKHPLSHIRVKVTYLSAEFLSQNLTFCFYVHVLCGNPNASSVVTVQCTRVCINPKFKTNIKF